MNGPSSAYPVLAVIGGGASGLIAAISAAETARAQNKKTRIVIFEANARVGKKLLVTGNGRCNLSNAHVSPENYTGDIPLFQKIYPAFDNVAALAFFKSLGLYTAADADGRIYPRSMKASSVLDALMFACGRLGVETVTDTRITSLKPGKGDVLLNGTVRARAAIAACGGLAGGGDQRSYGLFAPLGVRLTPLAPALTAFTVRDFPKSLKGVRAQGRMTLAVRGREIASEEGEIQYTEYGLSGYPAMQLTLRMPVESAYDGVDITVDSLPEISFEELRASFYERLCAAPEMPVALFLSGMVPKPLAAVFAKEAGLSPECALRDAAGAVERLAVQCKQKRYRVQGLRGYAQAQVTRGGIAAEEIGENLALKKAPHIYVCGELTDLAGECGGYNLQWAWSSGYIAGKNCVSENF